MGMPHTPEHTPWKTEELELWYGAGIAMVWGRTHRDSLEWLAWAQPAQLEAHPWIK